MSGQFIRRYFRAAPRRTVVLPLIDRPAHRMDRSIYGQRPAPAGGPPSVVAYEIEPTE